MRQILLIAALLLAITPLTALNAGMLQTELERYISDCGATVGAAVITDQGDTIAINNNARYPLNSVMKLHQAMAVIAKADRYRIPLDSMLTIQYAELQTDTWSPMRDKYGCGEQRCLQISLSSIIEYSVQQSDNNACDILFDRIVTIADTDSYIRRLGITDFAIAVNEFMMHQDNSLAASNWSTPVAAAALIHKLFNEQLFSKDYNDFLLNTLTGCSTGMKRLPSPLPSGAIIGHKTGTGFDDEAGHPMGINDVGFIRLADGNSYAIAVFVDRCHTDMDGAERIISDISSIVADNMVNNR